MTAAWPESQCIDHRGREHGIYSALELPKNGQWQLAAAGNGVSLEPSLVPIGSALVGEGRLITSECRETSERTAILWKRAFPKVTDMLAF